MIVVTAASGNLGSAVVESLLKHVPPSEVIASVRKPAAAGPLKARGVVVRHGDYDDPASLYQSFEGAQGLLLISVSGIDHEKRSEQHRNVIEAAVRAGVQHIYYTSLLPGADSVAFVMKAHLDTERDLKSSGLRYTILKNGVYAEASNLYLGDSGDVVIPADGPIAWVSRTDLAEGIGRLLFDGGHADQTLNLTGSEALDIKAVASLEGRAVRIVSVEEYVAKQMAAGKPEEYARNWATTYFGVARGEFGKVDPFLGELLGHPLRTIEDVLSGLRTPISLDGPISSSRL